MVKIGTVWDRTVDVLRGRAGILVGIAVLTMIVPALVAAVLRIFVIPAGGVSSVIGLATSVLLIYGLLAVTAVASDPHTDRRAAFGIAARRLGVALGILLLLVVAGGLLIVPVAIALSLSGATMTAAGTVDIAAVRPGGLGLAGVVGVLAVIAGLWLSARLVPVFGIVVNERRGLGAIRRSVTLTRGATLKLIGVLILYAIVIAVVMLASTSVVGVIARLLLGSTAAATVAFVVATVSAVVSTVASVVQSVFYARFYVAARERDDRMAPMS